MLTPLEECHVGAELAPPVEYVRRSYPPCAGCPARGQATDEQMAAHWSWRARFRPARVRLLLIAESPPYTVPGCPVRHFYHPAGPAPDTLFRATAPVLAADWADETDGRRSPARKAAALAALAERGFLLLDSAKCPVNHLASLASKRQVTRACAAVVLRAEIEALTFLPEARICLVVRGTVPQAALPVLRELGLEERVVSPEGLPFPGRWPGHRVGFQRALAAAAAQAGWPGVS
jgi:hypothetical protein